MIIPLEEGRWIHCRGSNNWQKYLNLSEKNDSAASASPPSSSFFRGLSDMSPAPDLGEEVQQVSPTHSISQTDLWNSLFSSAPTPFLLL
ncbi:hypothetical protein MTR67_007559 [Solanum verrucosum]|uniref:Uncharacterized protein n=1 Tax=Solanum verrucosum TaxID=315347 RepID=A0AAF0PZW2_SOLVR|nr:hypothetical protein MTR67_007559 [Solanum verrucosum]